VNIEDAHVAVLAENQYQELELWYPVLRLREAGASVTVVGPSTDEVYASKLGYPVTADAAIGEVDIEQFDAVVIPGGFAPEYLRRNPAMVEFIRAADSAGKTVAAICHAGWLLATAQIVSGRRVTSVPTIRDDVANAGGVWVDEPVVTDGNLITSRLPNDLPAFLAEIISAIEKRSDSAPAMVTPRSGRQTSARYDRRAVLKNRAAGPGSANYRAYAVLDDVTP
jgi:protease I